MRFAPCLLALLLGACDEPSFRYTLSLSSQRTLDEATLDGLPATQLVQTFSGYSDAVNTRNQFYVRSGSEELGGEVTVGCDTHHADVGQLVEENESLVVFDERYPSLWRLYFVCIGTDGSFDDNND
jgi:hypothetical protein